MTKEDELPDDKMISDEGFKKSPFPFWFWLFAIAILISLLSGLQQWYQNKISTFKQNSPFFDVTNRQFSLFLWENPQFMRVNVSSKDAYLPGFQYLQKISPHPELADKLVQAPPEILFHYHTWNRLIKEEISPLVITPKEFKEFLDYNVEWQPDNWPNSTPPYKKLVASLATTDVLDLYTLPETVLPKDVRLAFIGWKNFFKEGEAINKMVVNYGQLEEFLEKKPHFKRNYWRNLLLASDPNYLLTISHGAQNPKTVVEKDQLSPFLRVVLFNYFRDEKPSSKIGP